MDINGISSVMTSTTPTTQKEVTKDVKSTKAATEDVAATYESSSSSKKVSKEEYKKNPDLVASLKADLERRTGQLRSLVEKMFLKQGQTFSSTDEMYRMIKEGNYKADPETIAQAKKDIAEDGYWGVAQTSERLVSFAKALTGGDPEMADKMIKAVEKGFKQAEKVWGGKLPDLCQQTVDETIKQLNEWKSTI